MRAGALVVQIHDVHTIQITEDSKHKDNAGTPWFSKRSIQFLDERGETLGVMDVFGNPHGIAVIDQNPEPGPVCWKCSTPLTTETQAPIGGDICNDCAADVQESPEAFVGQPAESRSEFDD